MTEGSGSSRLLMDEDRFGGAADAMVEYQLRRRGILDRRVLEAMRRVPRHGFVDESLQGRAYDDAALPTLHGQTISQPYMVALMTQSLAAGPRHRVLEIGTGSGYQTMILAMLGASVVSVERDAELAERARRMLAEHGVRNVQVYTGDGTLGWPDGALYDRILVTAGAPQPPPALLEQLAEGGRLVIPIGDRELQHLLTIDKRDGKLIEMPGVGCRFVPLVGEQGWR